MTRCEQLAHLQKLIGAAKGHHENDRDPHGFEKAQKLLDEAFNLIITMRDKCKP